ncbi:hypothetical protein LWI29_034738 [Acer saccharum]|uniref:Uncharacterized protein n=1 Tax=Acer saccharum TaxID=4024 RepID=A0AA39SB10_ACESA|nr:hypothetical protein LWI29_034738 [Acer saccharum]
MILFILVKPSKPDEEVNNIRLSSVAEVHVGVIVDMGSWSGKIGHSCISMAISDFCALNNKTRVLLHWMDSKDDSILALHAGNRGLDLIVDFCEKVNGDSSRNVEGDILQQDEKSYNLEQEIIGERKKQHLQEESEKCGSVRKCNLGSFDSVDGRGVSLGSVESVLSNRRSVKIFGSKDGSCGGVSVSGNQVVYFNFEDNKDSKGGNYVGPAIDLFVDLGGLEPFVRKGNVEESVVSSCLPVARRKIKNFFPTRSHRMKTRSGARGFN